MQHGSVRSTALAQGRMAGLLGCNGGAMLPFEAGFIYTICVKQEGGVAFSVLDSPSSFPILVQELYVVT